MARARGDRGLDGFLNVAKPSGPTSHDQVAAARRLFGTRRVGHAGTLDPLASGVLPIALGRATRLIDHLAEADKSYRAIVELGLRTATDDLEGEILERRPVPRLEQAEIESALRAFVGRSLQRPPAFSAAKIGGRRAYALARGGHAVEVPPREVEIYRLELLDCDLPRFTFEVDCSKGTYVRSLARDLGLRLGTVACLAGLVRLRVGRFRLEEAVSLAELGQWTDERRLTAVRPADVVVDHLPALVLDERALEDFRYGRPWGQPAEAEEARVYDGAGRFIGVAIADAASGAWRPRLSFLD